MLTSIAYAEGSPSSTFVIDASNLPNTEEELRALLYQLHSGLDKEHKKTILKYAFIRRRTSSGLDLEYQFAQMIPVPNGEPFFDFNCSCGHSALAAVSVAYRWGWLPKLLPGMNAQIYMVNNGDTIFCEVKKINRDTINFNVHFIQPLGTKFDKFFLMGEPLTMLKTPVGVVETSIVSVGNPYVFIDAVSLGISTSRDLFSAGEDVFTRLQSIRIAAAQHLGWSRESLLPKIAVVGAFSKGCLTVRAISVPSWHPSLALTGAICVSAAATIETSVVGDVARRAGCTTKELKLYTPGGFVVVSCDAAGRQIDDTVYRISVFDQLVRLISSIELIS